MSEFTRALNVYDEQEAAMDKASDKKPEETHIEEIKWDWKDVLAFSIAAIDTVGLPYLVIIAVLIVMSTIVTLYFAFFG